MFRIDSDAASSTKPAYTSLGSPSGYFQPGDTDTGDPATVISHEWTNHVQEELSQAILEFGGTLSKADDAQLADVLAARIHAILCAASDTGSVTTTHLRAVLASTTSQASGAESAVVACDDYRAAGANSFAAASDGDGSTQTVGALRSFVIGCLQSGTAGSGGREAGVLASELSSTSATARAALIASSLYALITGTRCVVLATQGTSAVNAGATGTNSAVVGCLRTDGSVDAGGAQGLVGASEDSAITGGTEGAVLASEDSFITGGARTAAIASRECTNSAENAAIIGARSSSAIGTSINALLAASSGSHVNNSVNTALVGSLNAEVASRAYGLALGHSVTGISPTGSDQNLSIWLSASAATGYADAWSTAGADFAELFPCREELPPGSLVAMRWEGGRRFVAIAQPGEQVLGVVSAAPSILAGEYELAWQGAYERDEWGRYVYDHIPCVRITALGRVLYDGPASEAPAEWPRTTQRCSARGEAWAYVLLGGVVVWEGPEAEVPRQVRRETRSYLAPQRRRTAGYDPSREYVPRRQRPAEWCPVALLGQVRVAVGRDVVPGDQLRPTGHRWAEAGGGYGRRVQALDIAVPYSEERGYAVALCLVG